MRFLSLREYDDVLLAALRRLDLDDASAHRLIASRWPMPAGGLPGEGYGRGLIIGPADFAAYVCEFAPDAPADCDALLDEGAAEEFFQWCVSTGRARLTEVGRALQRSDTDRVLRDINRRAAASMN